MSVAWKFLFPLALINLLVTALQVLAGWPEDMPWLMGIVNYALLGILILLWSRMYKVGEGRVEV
jgi:NADH-quinone oxidoreductase subunit H